MSVLRSTKRILAMLMLPLSIAPVMLLGPSVLRAPITAARDIERAARQLDPFAVQAALASVPHRVEHRAGRCAGRAPRRLRTRRFGGPRVSVLLSWRAPAHGRPATYRVVRSGRTVGQTHGRAMVVNVWPGKRTKLTVQARYTRAPRVCATSLRKLIRRAVRRAPSHRPGASAQGGGAAPSAPTELSVSEVSDTGATLWWLPSTPGGARIVGYRVYRDNELVGQTTATTMRLTRLSTLRTYTITVSAVDEDKRESPRSAPLRLTTTHTPPDGPSELSALSVTDTSATLAWQPGSPTSESDNAESVSAASLVGYLIYEDGQPERVVSGLQSTLTLASERHYTFVVRALDSDGYLSAPSPTLEVFTTHTPPSTPTNLTASEVTSTSAKVTWSASAPVSGSIVGYRVFRDDIPVGQTSATEMTLSSLAPSTRYEITVNAVDSLGAISAPTPALAIETTAPTPTHGTVQAYLLASTDQSFDDLQAHYQQIGVVYPTYFNCGAQGAVTGVNDPLVTGWAQAREIAVMPRVNCQEPRYEDEILNEPSVREATIDKLAALGGEYGYQGFQIDFEGAAPTEREPFTAFVAALAARLHAQGEKLSTCVTAKYYNVMTGRAAMYNDAALSESSDYVFVLDWGLHWTTSVPGPLAELGWFTRVADYTATLPNKDKFVLGMPMYGIDWPNGGGPSNPGTPLEFDNVSALIGEYGATPEWEPTAAEPHFSYVDASGVSHSVWYVDRQSLEARVAVAQSLGLGVGLWRLGSEDQSIWSLPGLGGSD